MSAGPESTHHNDGYHEGLTELSENQIDLVTNWYEYINDNVSSWLRPIRLPENSEEQFALQVRRLVATRVEQGNMGHQSDVLINGHVVAENIGLYYQLFPASNYDPAVGLQRVMYQNQHLETARRYSGLYPEIVAGFALRRAFRNRRQRAPTRAMFALLSAYGETVSTD